MTLGYANGAFAADTAGTAEKHGGDHPGQAVGLAKQTTEVIVRKDRSDAQRMRDSANPVKVLDTYYARQQARDLGDVLAGIEGVSVRDVVRRNHALGV